MKKNLEFPLYTEGRYGEGYREILDEKNGFLYGFGKYSTKIRKEDLPEEYIEIRSRAICYMTGYLQTCGIVDMRYEMTKLNHLLKDDYLYIS